MPTESIVACPKCSGVLFYVTTYGTAMCAKPLCDGEFENIADLEPVPLKDKPNPTEAAKGIHEP